MYTEILLFGIFRFFTWLICKGDNLKGYPLYTYYVSVIFQMLILPFLCILYYFNIISPQIILNISIGYFMSDMPQLYFLKDNSLIVHHILAMICIYLGKYVHTDLLYYPIVNTLAMELGSSILSLPYIFKWPFLYKIRTLVYLISRIFSFYNSYLFIIDERLDYNKYVFFKYLTILLLIHNTYLFYKLLKKDIKYLFKSN